jgi:transcriptional regulator with XRE-family HTH domain
MLIEQPLTFNVMSQSIWNTFGPWIQSERELAGVSQQKVASKADIHVIQVSRIENGHSGIKRETLERLVNAINELSDGYKVDLNEALRRAGYASADQDAYGLSSGMDRLSPERRLIAQRQIKAIIDALSEDEISDTDYTEGIPFNFRNLSIYRP